MGRLNWKERVRRKFPFLGEDVENLIGAIEGNKYWYAVEGRKDLVYAVALTRARTFEEGRFWARCTGLGRVFVPSGLRKYVRRYKILLIDRGSKEVIRVLTWKAFRVALELNLPPEKMPSYMNFRSLKVLLDDNPLRDERGYMKDDR